MPPALHYRYHIPTRQTAPRSATALAIGLQLPEHNVHVRTNSFLRRTTSAAGVTATAMKPAPFVYHAPASLGAALLLKAEHGDGAKFLAGGQSLIPAMNFRIAGPALLVDVNKLAALDYVRRVDDELRIGALTRVQRLERDPLVCAHWPLLPETVPHIAHPQIRNRSTVGGSLAHADPAAELPVILTALGGRLLLQSAIQLLPFAIYSDTSPGRICRAYKLPIWI